MIAGDIHHIFPRAYLKKQGIDNRARYNQVANYIYLDTQVNKAIGDQAPYEYFGKVIQQCEVKAPVLGNIVDTELLKRNLDENCIPQAIHQMDFTNYEEFLSQRRYLMASKMEEYYRSL